MSDAVLNTARILPVLAFAFAAWPQYIFIGTIFGNFSAETCICIAEERGFTIDCFNTEMVLGDISYLNARGRAGVCDFEGSVFRERFVLAVAVISIAVMLFQFCLAKITANMMIWFLAFASLFIAGSNIYYGIFFRGYNLFIPPLFLMSASALLWFIVAILDFKFVYTKNNEENNAEGDDNKDAAAAEDV